MTTPPVEAQIVREAERTKRLARWYWMSSVTGRLHGPFTEKAARRTKRYIVIRVPGEGEAGEGEKVRRVLEAWHKFKCDDSEMFISEELTEALDALGGSEHRCT